MLKRFLTYRLLLMLITTALLGLMLAGCSDFISNMGADNGPTPTAAPPATGQVAPITPTPIALATPTPADPAITTEEATLPATSQLAATPTAKTNPTATARPATPTSAPSFRPIIQPSATHFKVDGTIGVMGSGFPANRDLQVTLLTQPNIGGPPKIAANGKTDARGIFNLQISLASLPFTYKPGQYLMVIRTLEGDAAAEAQLTLEAAVKSTGHLTTSTNPITIGKQFSLKGTGFPPNTTLQIRGGIQNLGQELGSVKTDANGNFTQQLTLSPAANSPTSDGYPYIVWVGLALGNDQGQASIQVKLVA